jgi:predicted transposase YbfD/YdcC
MGAFADVFGWLVKHFGRSFAVVTHDAGACSRENALLVHRAQKAYVFSVKENQPTLLQTARTRLGSREESDDGVRRARARTDDRARGLLVTRELFSCKVEQDDPETEFPTARELWRVRLTKVRRNEAGKELERIVSDRYFVTNQVFSAERALKLVRLHWGIENGANWAMDMVMGEDDGSPCLTGHGLENVSWLRLLALNLVKMLRVHLPESHGEVPSYRAAARALVGALQQPPSQPSVILETLA